MTPDEQLKPPKFVIIFPLTVKLSASLFIFNSAEIELTYSPSEFLLAKYAFPPTSTLPPFT